MDVHTAYRTLLVTTGGGGGGGPPDGRRKLLIATIGAYLCMEVLRKVMK